MYWQSFQASEPGRIYRAITLGLSV